MMEWGPSVDDSAKVKRKRVRIWVRWNREAEAWAITSGEAEFEGIEQTKEQAVSRAREIAKADAPSELVIFTKKGRIQETRSYGTDPRRTKG